MTIKRVIAIISLGELKNHLRAKQAAKEEYLRTPEGWQDYLENKEKETTNNG